MNYLPARITVWLFVSFAMILLVDALTAEMPATRRIPVQISIQKVNGRDVTFQPVLPAQFVGALRGEIKGNIHECIVVMEPIGELKDGAILNNIVLHCGDATIVVNGVMFQN